jgi:hypothetical protein
MAQTERELQLDLKIAAYVAFTAPAYHTPVTVFVRASCFTFASRLLCVASCSFVTLRPTQTGYISSLLPYRLSEHTFILT